MKLITFLGIANYQTTTYVWQGREHTTRFFPDAAAYFLRPEQTLVCATPTVEKHANLIELTSKLADANVNYKVVPIPEGHSEADLWRIFDALTNVVDEGETVAFDVTHSFRSLPFLSFLAVAYLQAAKQVKVERVLYGAFEAHDNNNHSPVFDLTPFVTLLDWLTATTRFVETGDGQALANLLRAGMPPGIQMRDDLAARTLGQNLKTAADAIQSVSLALRVARPLETMQSAAQLAETLEQAMPGIQKRAKPFQVLAEKVAQEYGQFAVENPTDEKMLRDSLRRQLRMIEWYIKRRHVVQAATLAREWIVSALCLCFGEPMFDYEGGRKHVEGALNNAVERRKENPRPIYPSRCDVSLEGLANVDLLARLWGQMTELRNDIAHVGMKLSPKPAALLKQKVETMYPQLLQVESVLFPDEQTGLATD